MVTVRTVILPSIYQDGATKLYILIKEVEMREKQITHTQQLTFSCFQYDGLKGAVHHKRGDK